MSNKKKYCVVTPLSIVFISGALVGVVSGCSGGEYRAEDLPSKTEVQKEIDTVTSSTTISPSAKPMIISGLKRKLERAK